LIPLYIDDKTNMGLCPPGIPGQATVAPRFARRIKALTGNLPCIGGMEARGRRGLQINDAWI
jgi:hypothetical protein